MKRSKKMNTKILRNIAAKINGDNGGLALHRSFSKRDMVNCNAISISDRCQLNARRVRFINRNEVLVTSWNLHYPLMIMHPRGTGRDLPLLVYICFSLDFINQLIACRLGSAGSCVNNSRVGRDRVNGEYSLTKLMISLSDHVRCSMLHSSERK